MDALDRTLQVVLGGGSLLFGAWGLLRPESLGRLMGASESDALGLGFRDAAAGTAIAVAPGPVSYGLRAAFDVSDAVRFGTAKPGVGVGALGFAGLAVLAAIRSR